MSYSPDPIRAGGPAVVTEGTPDGPIALVLDPAGEGTRDTLPATCCDLLADWRAMWCRMPGEGGLGAAAEILTDPPGNRKTAHLVTAGGPWSDE